MFQVLFITSLFLPTVLRVLLAFVFPPHGYLHVRLTLFLIPMIAVAILLCVTGFSAGVYGLFVPLMIATFWTPQLAFIAFFAWCDSDNVTSAFDNPQKPTTPGSGVSE